ncbi:hypothetical protein OnM2_079005 [Erysiphe neolycopersici]|uniref:Retrotransposon gag domain-containing protein n=1 Tax=Erysiphe neolycopersici TaxID=212602 RepID=A0A420HH31_9PEZI|nr:hypothetical protein OnM2_079005 [Erysiphe neolycopersici]
MAPNFYKPTLQSPEKKPPLKDKLPRTPPKTIKYPTISPFSLSTSPCFPGTLIQDKNVDEELDYINDDEIALKNALAVNRTMQSRILQLEMSSKQPDNFAAENPILKNESVPNSRVNQSNTDNILSQRNAFSDNNIRRAVLPNLSSKLNDGKDVSPDLWKLQILDKLEIKNLDQGAYDLIDDVVTFLTDPAEADNARNGYLNRAMKPNQTFWDFYRQFRILASTAGITQDLVLRADLRDKVLTRLRSSVVNEWPRCKTLQQYAAALLNQDADYHARRSRNDRRNINRTASYPDNGALVKNTTFASTQNNSTTVPTNTPRHFSPSNCLWAKNQRQAILTS